MDKFSKIDALLPMFFDKDDNLTVSIEELIKIMKENNMKLPGNIKEWKKIVKVSPKFENIENLLGNHDFLQKLKGSSFDGINLAIRIDNLSMFKFYFTGFPNNFLTISCNLHSKNIAFYMLNYEEEILKNTDIDYDNYLNSWLNNMNEGVSKEIKDLIYNKIKDVVERNPRYESLKRILDIATERKQNYDRYSEHSEHIERIFIDGPSDDCQCNECILRQEEKDILE